MVREKLSGLKISDQGILYRRFIARKIAFSYKNGKWWAGEGERYFLEDCFLSSGSRIRHGDSLEEARASLRIVEYTQHRSQLAKAMEVPWRIVVNQLPSLHAIPILMLDISLRSPKDQGFTPWIDTNHPDINESSIDLFTSYLYTTSFIPHFYLLTLYLLLTLYINGFLSSSTSLPPFATSSHLYL